MPSDSSVFEFGFDDAKVIKATGLEAFKQSKAGEKSRITIIAFKRYHEVELARKARENGKPLSDAEKAELMAKIDQKIAEHLKKEPKDLTELDRLDPRSPKFSFAFTHFSQEVGTIRCKGVYENGQLVRPGICCDKIGDAEQTVATVIMQYPVDSDGQVDMDLFRVKKYTNIYAWKLGSKKFKKLEGAYLDARNDKRLTIDLKVELDGDPKYQKQNITCASGATWAREEVEASLRSWVLDQGVRMYKYVQGHLGFDMPMDRLQEKLGEAKQLAAEAPSNLPKLQQDYGSLLD